MAVGALADQMEKPFIKYMEAFLPILVEGLSNNAEYQVRHVMSCRDITCRVIPAKTKTNALASSSPYSSSSLLFLLC